MGVSLEETQKKLDKALKRNLETQSSVPTVTAKLPDPVISETEQITKTDD